MKHFKHLILALVISLLFVSCEKKEEIVTFTFLQLNDVYEIAALEGGEVGGMDRVETLHQQLLEEDSNTFVFMAGDFLNPSLLGNIKYQGERIKGKQMIEVMNAMNFDLVAFGNHEFDLSEELLQERIDSSKFKWIGTNVKHKLDNKLEPFFKTNKNGRIEIPETVIFNINNKKGNGIKIGFFSATIPSNPKPFVDYSDFYEDAKHAYNSLEPKTDIIFGLTHVKISHDKMLANMLPNVSLIMGGHEHINMLIPVGKAVISKADANAKTVYVHRFTYNINTKELIRKSELVSIDNHIKANDKISKIISKWQSILDKKIAEFSPNAYDVIFEAKIPLNGEDNAVRSMQTNLGELIAKAMAFGFDNKVDGALVNGGSMRIDDMLSGNITGVDIFRVLPFGGGAVKVKIKGDLLIKVLNYGRINKGTGAYLQRYNFRYDHSSKKWFCANKLIENEKVYEVAFSDYLLKGLDIPFLKEENPGIIEIYQPKEDEISSDIRRVVIAYLKSIL